MNTRAANRIHQEKSWWDQGRSLSDAGEFWRDGSQSSPDSVVASPDTIVDGHTISQWTENWWQWAAQTRNGPFDTGGTQSGHQGDMTFIAGLADATIQIAAGKPILFPMINVFDTEGPRIETLTGFVDAGLGSYADEARLVTGLAQASIYDAHARLIKDAGTTHAQTIFDVHLQGPDAATAGVQSDIFALGVPKHGSYIGNALQGVVLDPSIKTLPFTASSGDWVEIDGLKPGTYTLKFGGSGHAVVDPISHNTLFGFGEGWGCSATDTLIVK